MSYDPKTHYVDQAAFNGGGGILPWQDETTTPDILIYREWFHDQRTNRGTTWWTKTAPSYADLLKAIVQKDDRLREAQAKLTVPAPSAPASSAPVPDYGS